MPVLTRSIGWGAGAGLALTALLAAWEAIAMKGYLLGLLTGLFGVAAGGILLVLGLLMAVTSYLLARRNLAPPLRRQLLAGAVGVGAAGITCGLSSAGFWLAMGQPWFP